MQQKKINRTEERSDLALLQSSELPAYQFGSVKIFLPYGDTALSPKESRGVFKQLCDSCQETFTDTKSVGGLLPMFDAQLCECHFDRMQSNVLGMVKRDDVYLKCEMSIGDIELACDLFTLGGGQISFDLTNYLVVVVRNCSYSVYLTDLPKLYATLCQKVKQIQQKFGEQVSKLFLQEVTIGSGSMAVCHINDYRGA